MGVSQVFYFFVVSTAAYWGAALSGWFKILSMLFILTYMEGKLCGEGSRRWIFNKYAVST